MPSILYYSLEITSRAYRMNKSVKRVHQKNMLMSAET